MGTSGFRLCIGLAIFAWCGATAWGETAPAAGAHRPVGIKIDPVTRYIHISYAVPRTVGGA